MDDLTAAEAEMAESAAEARVRLKVALAWLREADAVLGGLDRPRWGGPVDDWFRAEDAVFDSAETCAAFGAFPPYTGG